jgi:sulfofructose kinase
MKVLGIGESVIDDIRLFGPDGVMTGAKRDAGGPVLVAMLFLVDHGLPCSFVTSYGDDDSGRQIGQLLGARGVRVYRQPVLATKMNSIRVDSATGRREKTRSDMVYPPLAALSAAFLAPYDVIVMDRHERAAFYEVARNKRPDALIITDPSTELSDFTLDMMRASAVAIVPIETLAQIDGVATLDEALRALYAQCGNLLVVTLGELGSLSFDGVDCELVPPFAIDAIDALGAGDVFRGAYAYGQLRQWTVSQRLRYANAAAALQCTKVGNAAVVPPAREIERLMTSSQPLTVDFASIASQFEQLLRHYQPAILLGVGVSG